MALADRYGEEVTEHVPLPGRPQLPVLRTLRVALHVLFAVLLLFGLGRYLWSHAESPQTAPALCAITTVVLLAAVYLVGTVWENRWARSRKAIGRDPLASAPDAPQQLPPGRPVRDPHRWAGWWLAAVATLWICLVLISPDFVWVAFPLMFLFLHLCPRGPGLAAVALLWAVCALVPLLRGEGTYSAGYVLGPLLGAGLAVVISQAYRSLAADAQHHARVSQALRLAQDELALREHRAGRLEERERLSREIHDTVAQGLSSILLVARAARAGLAAGDVAGTQRQLAVIEEGAATHLAEARRFVRDLAAAPEGPGLPQELAALCTRVQAEEAARGRDLACSLRVEGTGSEDLPEPVRTALLRGAQASLGNVAAHAQAHRAVLTLTVTPEEALLDVYDDGVGFDPARFPARARPVGSETGVSGSGGPEGEAPGVDSPAARTRVPGSGRGDSGSGDSGYGLPGLRRRLQGLGGSLAVDSAPGEGTVVGMRVPLTSARPDAGPHAPRPEEDLRGHPGAGSAGASVSADTSAPVPIASPTPGAPTRKDRP